jgi:hypothetical protein
MAYVEVIRRKETCLLIEVQFRGLLAPSFHADSVRIYAGFVQRI